MLSFACLSQASLMFLALDLFIIVWQLALNSSSFLSYSFWIDFSSLVFNQKLNNGYVTAKVVMMEETIEHSMGKVLVCGGLITTMYITKKSSRSYRFHCLVRMQLRLRLLDYFVVFHTPRFRANHFDGRNRGLSMRVVLCLIKYKNFWIFIEK